MSDQDQAYTTGAQSATQVETDTQPRIYVACLAAYNNAKLHGEWIDAAQDEGSILEEINKMLAASPEPNAEEWAIHDYEHMPSDMGENPDLAEVSAVACAIEEHGAAFMKYLDICCNAEDALASFEDAYCGEYESLAAYAEELISDYHEIPEFLQGHIDWDSFAHDLDCDGYHWVSESAWGVGYVFRPV